MEPLQSLIKQLERSPQWQASATFRQLAALWPQLVGTAVADHSQPRKVQRSVLMVAVSSASWAQTLAFERRRILAKIHQQLPSTQSEIKDIRFAAAQWRSPQPTQGQLAKPQAQLERWAASPKRPADAAKMTLDDAFSQWSHQKRLRLANQSHCPRCHRPCPTQEITRYRACAICIAQTW